ncbi:hypothetical protein niasHT_016731 [Heterodera trifolii]|uniref:Uncharacterized protein n=1 Tax=Heterodera trifolii TaxID=157864 RepID=A0ABD2KW52_9BILA
MDKGKTNGEKKVLFSDDNLLIRHYVELFVASNSMKWLNAKLKLDLFVFFRWTDAKISKAIEIGNHSTDARRFACFWERKNFLLCQFYDQLFDEMKKAEIGKLSEHLGKETNLEILKRIEFNGIDKKLEETFEKREEEKEVKVKKEKKKTKQKKEKKTTEEKEEKEGENTVIGEKREEGTNTVEKDTVEKVTVEKESDQKEGEENEEREEEKVGAYSEEITEIGENNLNKSDRKIKLKKFGDGKFLAAKYDEYLEIINKGQQQNEQHKEEMGKSIALLNIGVLTNEISNRLEAKEWEANGSQRKSIGEQWERLKRAEREEKEEKHLEKICQIMGEIVGAMGENGAKCDQIIGQLHQRKLGEAIKEGKVKNWEEMGESSKKMALLNLYNGTMAEEKSETIIEKFERNLEFLKRAEEQRKLGENQFKSNKLMKLN